MVSVLVSHGYRSVIEIGIGISSVLLSVSVRQRYRHLRCLILYFPNSGSCRVLVVFQRTGEFQESPQDFSAAGTGQAMMPPKPPEDENGPYYISSIGRVAGRLAEVV